MCKRSKADSFRSLWPAVLILGCLLIAAFVVEACSSSSSVSTGSGMGTVSTMLSDPATCQAPDGPYSHVYVTITDAQANVSATASATDSGWVDLTPSLSKSPQQIDLLGQANNQCLLATLGDAQQLQAGNYQQIRLILASNSATVTNNNCGSAANCVVLASDSSVHTLQLSSEAQTGIKIPSGQIASGGFSVSAGQTKDLDIDFDTCESIVVQGNGQYRLKPVLHAGEVSTTSSSINGKVVDNATGNPVNGTVRVAAELKDSTGVDRIVMAMNAGADGTFVFCPLPAGTYDIVAVGTRSDATLYQPSIVTGVTLGSTTGNVKLYPSAAASTSSATFNGMVTSQNALMAGTVTDVQLSGLETVSSATYTIPLPPTSAQNSDALAVETAASTSTLTCPNGTECVDYSLVLPSGGPYIGAWSSSGLTLAQSSPLASYAVDAAASLSGTPDCSPSEVKSSISALAGAGPFTVSVSNIAFAQCQ